MWNVVSWSDVEICIHHSLSSRTMPGVFAAAGDGSLDSRVGLFTQTAWTAHWMKLTFPPTYCFSSKQKQTQRVTHLRIFQDESIDSWILDTMTCAFASCMSHATCPLPLGMACLLKKVSNFVCLHPSWWQVTCQACNSCSNGIIGLTLCSWNWWVWLLCRCHMYHPQRHLRKRRRESHPGGKRVQDEHQRWRTSIGYISLVTHCHDLL